jgi:F-type H+-transporting ATPase subunit gamma
MPSLRSIRNRIESVRNTKQITKAMKMVAAAKLRRAQDRIIDARPYSSNIRELVGRLAREANEKNELLLKREKIDNVLFIVVGSDRGLCGGFNNNLFREVKKTLDSDFSGMMGHNALSILAIGRKAAVHYGKRTYPVWKDFPGFFEDLQFRNVSEIMKAVVSQFKKGTFDEVYLAYNEFESVITQNRLIEKMLPIDPEDLLLTTKGEGEHINYIYEPDVDTIFQEILPLHLRMQLWKAVLESNAAEQGARMTSMDNATDNAEELEGDLQLEYNRARQSAITTEISEIMGGAQALEEA